MITLGITFKPTHPAAAIIVNGKIVAAIAEERFNRIKGGGKQFPINSIKFCLDQAGVKATDVDFVVGSFNYEKVKDYFHKSYYITKSYRGIGSFNGMSTNSLYHNIDNDHKVSSVMYKIALSSFHGDFSYTKPRSASSLVVIAFLSFYV